MKHVLLFVLCILLIPFYGRAVATQDSLALVALYNNTAGDNWTFKTNWLNTIGIPVSQWHGIKVVNNRVTEITLFQNNLIGTIPPEIGDLTELTSLKLSSNKLTTGIIPEMSKLKKLTLLHLNSCQISNTIPSEIGYITALEELNLSSNYISGEIPPEFGNLKKLKRLFLHSNRMTGSIPPSLGGLPILEQLYLSNNYLSGSIPVALGLLSSLQLLMLNNNNLSGTIPTSLGSLDKLTYLYLHYNKLSGAIPSQLGNLSSLYYLQLNNNALRGAIPPELGNLSRLRNFYAQMNQLQGNIPVEIGNLSYLQQLNLSFNQLSGTIPADLGKLTNLLILDLSTNQFTGLIPNEIGQLKNLTQLLLDRNELSGSIPQAINKLKKLEFLSLTGNKLSGFQADSLHFLPNLNTISVYSNNLTFEDFEDKTALFDRYFYYSPQNQIGQSMIISVDTGATYILEVECGGANNRYQWYRDNQPLMGKSADSDYPLYNIGEELTGTYHCVITNTTIPDLQLRSAPIIIQFKPLGQYPPSDILLSNNSVEENQSIGTIVGSFNAVDNDLGDLHFFSLVNGEGSEDNNCFFLAANQLHTSLAFDYEEKSMYHIRIKCIDRAGLIFEKPFLIEIRDVPELLPNNIELSHNTVDEFLPSGILIGTFSAFDDEVEITEPMEYQLNDNPDTDFASFYIVNNELHSLQSFNRLEKSSYTISVTCVNQNDYSYEESFTIDVNKSGETLPADILLSSNTINENFPVGTFIGSLTTTGNPQSTAYDYTYTFVTGEGDSDNDRFFLAANQLHAAQEFNFETKSSYSIRILSTDKWDNTLEKNFTIMVVDLDDTHSVLIPDAFSPNNDGKNDFFEIPGIENYSNAVIDIYNRTGKLVYHSDYYGLTTEGETKNLWDGRMSAHGQTSSNLLPEGYYFVVLKTTANTVFKKTVFLKH
ncbi:MAG: T9SS type B sorting domain-containing protein [Bacteroidales bacterium]|nr:T9SS type B sorting domain-containing protein [Bacteroidales bacterium]